MVEKCWSNLATVLKLTVFNHDVCIFVYSDIIHSKYFTSKNNTGKVPEQRSCLPASRFDMYCHVVSRSNWILTTTVSVVMRQYFSMDSKQSLNKTKLISVITLLVSHNDPRYMIPAMFTSLPCTARSVITASLFVRVLAFFKTLNLCETILDNQLIGNKPAFC